jgi:hypothetical protein
MNRLEIRAGRHRGARPEWDEVRLYVDGRDLVELVRDVETPQAHQDAQPQLAGAYSGPPAGDVLLPSRHLFGDPAPGADWFGDGSVALLVCDGCREYGCWPLVSFIDVTDDTVTWRDFRQGHRNWTYEGFGPFIFDRRQYEHALTNPSAEASSGRARTSEGSTEGG